MLKVPIRKSVGSNPTLFIFLFFFASPPSLCLFATFWVADDVSDRLLIVSSVNYNTFAIAVCNNNGITTTVAISILQLSPIVRSINTSRIQLSAATMSLARQICQPTTGFNITNNPFCTSDFHSSSRRDE